MSSSRLFFALAPTLATLILASCGSSGQSDTSKPTIEPVPPPPAETDSGAAAATRLFETWAAAINASDFDKVATLYADDATFQTGNNPQKMVGGAQIAAVMKTYGAAFPDMENHTTAVFAKDRWIAVVGFSRGTNSGAMMGQPPTNKRSSFRGMQIWTINADNKIQTAVAYADNLNFLGQLGMWKGDFRPVNDGAPPERIDASTAGPEANRELATSLVAAIASHDTAAIAALYKGDAVLDDVSAVGVASGTEAVTSYWTSVLAMFPDLSYQDVEVHALGDHVIITYNFAGTNTGDLPRFGAKATGKPLALVSADVLRIVGGKIASHDIFMDGMSVGFMLGVMKM